GLRGEPGSSSRAYAVGLSFPATRSWPPEQGGVSSQAYAGATDDVERDGQARGRGGGAGGAALVAVHPVHAGARRGDGRATIRIAAAGSEALDLIGERALGVGAMAVRGMRV